MVNEREPMMQRAYSMLEIKAVDKAQRIITGIATTPAPDRMGDIVESEGAEFKLPIPLLWQHDSDQPIGSVVDAKVTTGGITVSCQFVKNTGVPSLDQRLDEAFASVESGLVRGLSIGFMPIETAQIEGSWSCRFTKWEWLELSAVTIPANAEAGIQAIKSADRKILKAKGLQGRPIIRLSAAVAANPTVAPAPVINVRETAMNTAEMIASLTQTRAAKVSAATAIMEKAATEGRTINEQEQDEFDGLTTEVETIDADLTRHRTVERMNAGSATAIGSHGGSEAVAVRAAATIAADPARSVPATVRTVEKLQPGVRFARVARCLGMGAVFKGADPLAIAQNRYPHDDAVYRVVKAAVDAATVANPDWAGSLVGTETTVFADFAEFLRPLTIIGRFGVNGVPGLRQVPFRTRLLGATGGLNGFWVGESKPIGLSKADFAGTTLAPLKAGAMTAISRELLQQSSPSADVLLRDGLGAALAERLDKDFIDPNNAGTANVKPAAITNGVSPVNSSGSDIDSVRADVRTMIGSFIHQNNQIARAVWVMPQQTALGLSLMVTSLDVPAFPDVTPQGGVFLGYPVIASEYVLFDSNGAHVFLVNADDVYFADDGATEVDFSQEASLEMSDSPGQDASQGTGASMVSMWQTNSVAYRALRTVNWANRVGRNPVAALNNVNWGNGNS